ncbi:hypothetical protein [Haladaptatus halobius]|uniref:hypothetical protein n=1 Tax=Haladaptatus halobius TaxID=2884875 RepID=UPI001D09C667|nr:hypothetical protein [Haladaptatus halobius]
MRHGEVVLVLLLLLSGAGTAAEDPTASDTERGIISEVNGGELFVGTGVGMSAANNSSVLRHKNPDNAAEKGSSEDVKRWLANRLSGRLNESVVQMSQGDYQRAKRLVGNDSEYSEMLGKYVNVSGGATRGESGKRFERSQRNQQQFVENVRSYRKTLKKYQKAKRNGNKQRANELARKLNQYSGRVKRNGDSLKRNLKNISSNETRFSNTTRTIDEISQNITQHQDSIAQREFTRTSLSSLIVQTPASFRNPLTVSGKLTAANGSALSSRPITLRIGNQSIRTKTDGDGWFNASYRPTSLKVGSAPRTIEYVPQRNSAYLGTNATVNVTIRQTEPTVEIEEAPNGGRYEDNLTVTGNVTAANVGASRVPVVVTVGGAPIGTAQTSSDGSFTVEGTLPANVSAGERRVRAHIAQTGRAIASAKTSKPITVRPTATDISINATRNGSLIHATGTLTTSTGALAANQTIQLRVRGRTVTTVRTNETGHYSAVTPLPNDTVSGQESVEVAAVYAEPTTNLESSTARVRIQLPGESTELADWRLWLAGVGLLGLIIGSAYAIRSRELLERDSDSDASIVPEDGTDEPDSTEESANGEVSRELLRMAREQLAAGQSNVAVQTAYAAVRQHLAVEEADDRSTGMTHWEMYRAFQLGDGDDDSRNALHELTRAYEVAAFAATSLSLDDARTAVDAAAALVSESTTD